MKALTKRVGLVSIDTVCEAHVVILKSKVAASSASSACTLFSIYAITVREHSCKAACSWPWYCLAMSEGQARELHLVRKRRE